MKLLILASLIVVPASFAADLLTLKLWPEGPPGQMIIKPAPKDGKAPNPNVITNITDPTITVYRPEKPSGTAVVVAPGGGFRFLSIKHEGTLVCEWLNTIGVTAVLLTYRTPTNEEPSSYEKPVQDAQRAIGMVRHHAAEWGIDPKRVGLLGFSAGGNLAGHASYDRGERTYPQKPELDGDARPDFMVMIYGGGFLDPKDKTNPIEAIMLYMEHKKLQIPAEVHIMTKGGHGFGMRRDGNPVNDWPQRCAEWMGSMGWLGK